MNGLAQEQTHPFALPTMFSLPGVALNIGAIAIAPPSPQSPSRSSSRCSSDAEWEDDSLEVRQQSMLSAQLANSSASSRARNGPSVRFLLPRMATCNNDVVDGLLQACRSGASDGEGKNRIVSDVGANVLTEPARVSDDSSGEKLSNAGSDATILSSSGGVLKLATWRHPTVFRCTDSSQDKLALSFERFRAAGAAANPNNKVTPLS